jgi:hypothetical protein
MRATASAVFLTLWPKPLKRFLRLGLVFTTPLKQGVNDTHSNERQTDALLLGETDAPAPVRAKEWVWERKKPGQTPIRRMAWLLPELLHKLDGP